jgi:formate/nitrite transporter FocA (FNT family)
MKSNQPKPQYLAPEYVTQEMCKEACKYTHNLSNSRILILSIMGGAFITVGALFSILLSTGIEIIGIQLLLQGFGFSAGFFFVILSGAILFTEVNVVLPASALNCTQLFLFKKSLKFWTLAWFGNMFGAFMVGWVLDYSHHYPVEHYELLQHIVAKKMQYQELGGISAWFQIVISGMFGNWMVGMAAFFAIMGQTIIGKYIPILLAVSLFVAGNFQHSPANMAYFSMIMPIGQGPGWTTAFVWNIIPAGIGNILGGTLLVALPLWYSLRPDKRESNH